ncbi:lysophospholipase catalytic domain-containing protein [Sarocladium implicatum]|nr:lysophospholipase catalytic domain-containing protein [Sarocladium implicatum]
MGVAKCLALWSAAIASVTAVAVEDAALIPRDPDSLLPRAIQNAPDGYIPKSVRCPSDRPKIRNGTSLSEQEKDWTLKRRNETIPHIRDLLSRIDIPDFDSKSYLKDVEDDPTALPNIGLAWSGGGYRALLNGAGALAAWDIRSAESDAEGNLGGLLQSATYVSGLSGGGWLVGSIYTNNFTTVQESLNSPIVWQFQYSILEGPEQYSLRQYFASIFDEVGDKKDAGYETSITDYWGRMLSYQLFNVSEGGPGLTFSSIAEDKEFADGKVPLPFIISVGRAPGEKIIALNSTVFEFTPWELGSSDPVLHGFAPLKYVGSNFTNGSIPDDGECVEGFDNAGFVLGTSSSLFNVISQYLGDDNSQYVPDDVPGFVVDGVVGILDAIGDDNNDIADWTPNPFKDWNVDENLSDGDRLTLVDGGEDLQNIPYHPHIFNERHVDVVFSVDSSADTDYSWPAGIAPVATYERSLTNISEGTSFPAIPGQQTFINLGLNTRPTFFGCNASNTSEPSPLIVYIPNYPYVFNSNISTFQMTTNESERDAMVENGWAVATQLNGTRDPDWPICVGCAMLSRSFDRTNTTVPDKCKECFESYCWNGTLAEEDHGEYDPSLFSEAIDVQDAAGMLRERGALALALAFGVAGFLSL